MLICSKEAIIFSIVQAEFGQAKIKLIGFHKKQAQKDREKWVLNIYASNIKWILNVTSVMISVLINNIWKKYIF